MKKTYCDHCGKQQLTCGFYSLKSRNYNIDYAETPLDLDLCSLECLFTYFIQFRGKKKLIEIIENGVNDE